MHSKQFILLPITLLGLVSCMPDSYPKNLTYSKAISYINKNSKGKATPKQGYVEYTCASLSVVTEFKSTLEALGAIVDETLAKSSNPISSNNITKYLNNSDDPTYDVNLPLMYLNETNFKKFVDKQSGFSYSLTYIKEFVMYQVGSSDHYYTRYYNTDLRLTRFEVHSGETNKEFNVTQTYIY